MAHVVGVPKRDPCLKCSMPVFLAERMTVGSHVYHRTCLKCARCSSQLTLGSFYETETDGEFCCETCPDEEDEDDNENKSSIAGRLAFFESAKNEEKVLSKSVSDEEKTKSLKAAYKSNPAFSHFLQDTMADEVDCGMPPELPDTQPPEVFTSTTSFAVNLNNITSPIANDALKNISSEETKDIEEDSKNVEQIDNGSESPEIDVETTNRLSLVRARLNQFEEINVDHKQEPKVPEILNEPELKKSDAIVKNEIFVDLSVDRNESVHDDSLEVKSHLAKEIEAKEGGGILEMASDSEEDDDIVFVEDRGVATIEEEEEILEVKERLKGGNEGLKEEHEIISTLKEEISSPKEEQENKNLNGVKEEILEVNENLNGVKEESLGVNENLNGENEELKVENEELKVENEELKVENEELKVENEELKEVTPIIEEHKILNEEPKRVQEEQQNLDSSSSETTISQVTSTEELTPIQSQEPLPEITVSKDPEYPDDLNPFQSEDDDEVKPQAKPRLSTITSTPAAGRNDSLNPFDSSDDEVELDKVKAKPPRPPPPKVSKNPFGSESEDDESAIKMPSGSRTPIPKPRTSTSTNPTPEPTPRPSLKQSFNTSTPLNDVYGSTASLNRYCDSRGSNNSLTSTSTLHSRKAKRAPAPPVPVVKELFPSSETISSQGSSNSSSTTPHQGRKKRPAPPPPSLNNSKNLDSCPQQNTEVHNQLSDEEKARLEGNEFDIEVSNKSSGRRLIALDTRILKDQDSSSDIRRKEEENVIYRRKIVPLDITTPTEDDDFEHHPTTRQLEKLKDNKESQNRNRQSQLTTSIDDDSFVNKSSHGKWKRRKGPAPQLPVPPRKVLQMLPLQEIRHELDIIEVQQQGLEKQGVVLEKMIRERCEGRDGELEEIEGKKQQNSKEVEDLILQLFELVNEKNELFRRQAELMYLRRQHRLEQEQADLEYEIRVLMAQPDHNKPDSVKAREEQMIARLVEVVQLRNEVIECLEMDRLREAEEDMSIKQQLEIHSAKRDNDTDSYSEKESSSQNKLSKKEKKKQKEMKKLGKSKKLDADKDTDESELSKEKTDKKKKKKFLFLH